MVGGDGDEEMADEPRALDEWPPPSANLELTTKNGSSQLLLLTVQYVGSDNGATFNPELESFSELDQQVVSPLDPNMGCTGSLSPVYRPSSPLMPPPVSPSGGYLNPSSPAAPATTLADTGMIVLSEPCQFSGESSHPLYTHGSQVTASTDDGKLLLLSTNDPGQSTELVVSGDDLLSSSDQRAMAEILLGNGTITYSIIESSEDSSIRVIQFPKQYYVAAAGGTEEVAPLEDQPMSVQAENVDDTALYDTLKKQGLIVEHHLDQMDPALVEQSSSIQSPIYPTPEPQQRFWCDECNMLLETDCREHQINRKITDKTVPSRARATLPASYLAINKVSDSDREEYGVFARKNIPKRTQFGPIEGVIVKSGDVCVVADHPHLQLTIETEGGELKALDVSNEHMSNWMRFVRMATSSKPPNLLLSQLGASLYFTTTHIIRHREELLVWYSPAYAARRNLPTDPPPPEYPCTICGVKLKSLIELTEHSTVHKERPPLPSFSSEKKEANLTVNSLRRKNLEFLALVMRKKKHMNGNKPAQKARKFECVLCNRRFHRRYNLRRHIFLMHARETVRYRCKVCNTGFSHSYSLLRHFRKSHPEHPDHQTIYKPTEKSKSRYESWTCVHCKMTFSRASILNLHLLVHAANNVEDTDNMMNVPSDIQDAFLRAQELVSCPQCFKPFTDKRKLANHVAKHSKSKEVSPPFHCRICGRNFTTEVRYEVHCETHRDEDKKPIQCEFCNRRLLTKSALAMHLKIHDCSVQWECPMCNEHFGNIIALRNHVHTHATDGFYHCPHCGKAFEEYSGIRKHIRALHCDRKHMCQLCDKRFATQDKLRTHMLKHSDIKDFLCSHCGKQFKRKDKLMDHMKRSHADIMKSFNVEVIITEGQQKAQEKKSISRMIPSATDYERYIYKCHECVVGFKRRGMLVNHLASKHPDIKPGSVPELNLPILKPTRDYFCQYCDKIYKSSSKRKAHILKNHPGLELPISNRQKGGIPEIPGLPNPTFSQTVGTVTTSAQPCQWCHKQYASKAKLLQHLRKKHAQLLPDEPQASPPTKSTNDVIDTDENKDKGDMMDEADTQNDTENFGNYSDIADPVPIALSNNFNNQIILSSENLQEYEIVATEEGQTTGILMDTLNLIRFSQKNDNISSDLISQAMSEIDVSLSDLRALSSVGDTYLKVLQSPGGSMLQDPYVPYTAR